MLRILKTYFVFFCLCYTANAQHYIDGGNTRHRFAQLNLGVDQKTLFGASSSFALNSSGQVEKFKLSNLSETRIVIGGTHFWGHSDFYIAIPVFAFGSNGFSSGVETGAKYYPWKIQHNKIRPYIGAAWLPITYQQGQGTSFVRSKFPLIAGLAFNSKKHLFELGFGYNYDNSLNYYISPTYKSTVKTNPFWVSLSYKILIETTLSAEKNWQIGKTQKLTDSLSTLKLLSGFTFSIGVSSAFFVTPSSHLAQVAPYADNHQSSTIFPEFSLGYYFHKPDIQLNVAYRSISSKLSAYDFSQTANSKALTFEAYKFLFDYHGFVPFLGLSVSQEWLNINEKDQQNATQTNYNGLFPGFTFGWDIRPNRLQVFYLRTNLRYFPNLNVKMNTGKNQPLDRIEFNFIELVLLPERFMKFR
jgi:hypothetical protein